VAQRRWRDQMKTHKKCLVWVSYLIVSDLLANLGVDVCSVLLCITVAAYPINYDEV
jgi:hypothetical protein